MVIWASSFSSQYFHFLDQGCRFWLCYIGDNRGVGIMGSLPFMAPETLQRIEAGHEADPIGYEADVWALGVTIIELLGHKKHPYFEDGDSPVAVLEKVRAMSSDAWLGYIRTEI